MYLGCTRGPNYTRRLSRSNDLPFTTANTDSSAPDCHRESTGEDIPRLPKVTEPMGPPVELPASLISGGVTFKRLRDGQPFLVLFRYVAETEIGRGS